MSALGPNITSAGVDSDGQRLLNVADPVNPQDGATKAFCTNASNLATGTIASSILGNSTLCIGSTVIALNRAAGALVLTGVTGGGLATSVAQTQTWDMTSQKDMGLFAIASQMTFTSVDAGAVPGGFTQASFLADGVAGHIPTFDGAPVAGWNNANGAVNKIKLENVGGYKYWTCGATTGTRIGT